MVSSADSSSSDDNNAMDDVTQEEKKNEAELIPEKSTTKYWQTYNDFMTFMKEQNAVNFDEDIFLVYFKELSTKYKATTLQCRCSMIKSMMKLHHNIDITTFNKLKDFLGNKQKIYQPRKSPIFQWSDIVKFLQDSSDSNNLLLKVILIFGMCGSLRTCEFRKLKVSQVIDNTHHFSVEIRDTENFYPRSFIIEEPFYNIVKEYIALRPTDTCLTDFFLGYQKGKIIRQVVGKNTFCEAPKTIARYLKLPNAEDFTGHSFRRTSASLFANSGASIIQIQQHAGWRSTKVAEGHQKNLLKNKRQIFQRLIHSKPVKKPRTVIRLMSTPIDSDKFNVLLSESAAPSTSKSADVETSPNTHSETDEHEIYSDDCDMNDISQSKSFDPSNLVCINLNTPTTKKSISNKKRNNFVDPLEITDDILRIDESYKKNSTHCTKMKAKTNIEDKKNVNAHNTGITLNNCTITNLIINSHDKKDIPRKKDM